ESDADRARFQVKRRYEMRNGEKFFAEGHERATLALRERQIQRAGQWRIGLRRAVLAHLARLGREPDEFPTPDDVGWLAGHFDGNEGNSYAGYMIFDGGLSRNYGPGRGGRAGGGGGGMFGGGGGGGGVGGMLAETTVQLPQFEEQDTFREANVDVVVQEPAGDFDAENSESAADEAWYETGRRGGRGAFGFQGDGEGDLRDFQPLTGVGPLIEGRLRDADVSSTAPARLFGDPNVDWNWALRGADDRWGPPFSVFPPLPAGYAKPSAPSNWPAEARAISQALLRNASLRTADGLEIRIQTRARESGDEPLKATGSSLILIDRSAWLTRVESRRGRTYVDWCDRQQRASVAAAFRLGSTRPPMAKDRLEFPVYLNGNVQQSLEEEYGEKYKVRIQPQAGDRVLLLLDPLTTWGWQYRILVDRARGVVLEFEQTSHGEQTTKTTFSDFVQVAGAWWAAKVEIRTPYHQRREYQRTFRQLGPGQFAERWQAEQSQLGSVQWLYEPLPGAVAAHEHRARTTFEDRLVLLREAYQRQDWSRVFVQFAAARRLALDVPGIGWLGIELLLGGHRAEEGRQRLLAAAGKLAAEPASADDAFLAEHALTLASNQLAGNEYLQLLDRLEPVFRRIAPPADGWRIWAQRREAALSRVGRIDESLALSKQLAERYPRDVTAQSRYVRALSAAGDHAQAFRVLDRVEQQLPRDDDASRTLRNLRIELLERRGDYRAVAERLARHLDDPSGHWIEWEQYLSALTFDNRLAEASKTAGDWLRKACRPEKLSAIASAQIFAAEDFAGKLHQQNSYALEPGWTEVLPEAAWCDVLASGESGSLSRLFYDSWFMRSDQGRQLIAKTLRMLEDKIDRLPVAQIERCLSWLSGYAANEDLPQWRTMRDLVRRRWQAEIDPAGKRLLGLRLAAILQHQFDGEGRAKVLRDIVQSDPPEHRAEDRIQWFDALLIAPWSSEHQRDALALIGQLGGEKLPPPALLAVRVGALQKLSDQMVKMRRQRVLAATAHPEQLTRQQWAAAKAAAGRQARSEFADRLQAVAGQHVGPLARWFEAEIITLRIRTGQDVPRQIDKLWAMLPADPAQAAGDRNFETLEPRLVHHVVTALMDLAARPGSEQLAGRTLTYLDRAIAAAPASTRWKLYKAQLLVALDRPQELERTLAGWVDAGVAESLWRRTLGYLLAEVGRLDAAIAQFEQLRASDDLDPGDQRTLADWYLAVDRQRESRQALAAAYAAISDWRLLSWLHERQNRWEADASKPTGSDNEARQALLAVLKKSNSNDEAARLALQFYQHTHDERLLVGLPDTVLGHTAEGIYPLLKSLAPLLAEVRNEAGSDRMLERIRELRSQATTNTDRRALDLFETLVERAAAEIVDQPGPHVQAALAALARAFDQHWADGEPALMAGLLLSLGKISQQPLATEQLRELAALYERAPRGPDSTLQIAVCLAATQALYGRLEDAARTLEAALDEHARAHGGGLPASAREALSALVGYYEQLGQFRRGEQRLNDELARAADGNYRQWLTRRIYLLDSK
ncbi:MAG TPA: hypothetical protein VIK18_15305, partial [Pirellulales bacterium]